MGVEKTVLRPGSGRTPKSNEVVVCHYVGTLTNGTKVQFDSSRDRNKPLTFMIGIGSVIKGWDEGIMGMQLGELARLTVSPDYGYGEEIPPNAELIFEVELLQAGDDKAAKSGGCTVS